MTSERLCPEHRYCEGPCGRELAFTPDYFPATGYGYLRSVCRACYNVGRRSRTSTAAERKRRNRKSAEYRSKHLEEIAAYRKAWGQANAERLKSYQRDYFQRRGKYLQRLRRSKLKVAA